jgi:hypothetical protein
MLSSQDYNLLKSLPLLKKIDVFCFISAYYDLGRFNFENVGLLCRDLPANPCREIVARRAKPAWRQSQDEIALMTPPFSIFRSDHR